MFDSIIRRFSSNIEALREFVDLVRPVLVDANENAIRENPKGLIPAVLAISEISDGDLEIDRETLEKLRSSFDGTINIDVSEKDGRKSAKITIDGPDEANVDLVMDALSKGEYQISLLYQNALIALVSAAEWFLVQVLHKHFELHPDSAGVHDRSLTLTAR